jgi:5-methylthioadenosine/S-adenosylhomocysteine deaminase
MQIDLIIDAAYVLPIEPAGVVLNTHSVGIQGDRIVSVGPTEQIHQTYRATEKVVLPRHVLMPGLINAHTHNPMTLMRGLADDLPLMSWLQQHIWPAESKAMSADFVRDGVELAIAEMLRGGTTCTNDNYFFPDVAAATYQRYGFRAMVGLPVIDFPSAWAKSGDEYFEKALAVYERFQDSALLKMCFAPHAPYTVHDANFKRVRVLADQLDVPVHLHLHETAHEIEESKRQYGVRPMQRIQQLGLLNSSLIAVHMTQLTSDEIELCARYGVYVVHCPESNLKLASGFCPVADLQRAGVDVCIGTDGCASNNDLDMFGEMRTAALVAKGVACDASVVNATTALRMATINAAKALGWSDQIGSLEPGKKADIIAINLDQVETLPHYDVQSALVYSSHRRQVSDVWIAGQQQLKNGHCIGMDLEQIADKARYWAKRIGSKN